MLAMGNSVLLSTDSLLSLYKEYKDMWRNRSAGGNPRPGSGSHYGAGQNIRKYFGPGFL